MMKAVCTGGVYLVAAFMAHKTLIITLWPLKGESRTMQRGLI